MKPLLLILALSLNVPAFAQGNAEPSAPTSSADPAAPPASVAPSPEECVLTGPEGAAASVEHGGKTYHFKSAACKDEFLTDPERYAQLYDALLELKAEGKPLPKQPSSESAVPA
jgi:YHS domain-containing protein